MACKYQNTAEGYIRMFPDTQNRNEGIFAKTTTKGVFSLKESLDTQNLVVKFDGGIRGGVLAENASDNFPQQKKLENNLPNFARSSPPISPKTSPTSLWKALVFRKWTFPRRPLFQKIPSSNRMGVCPSTVRPVFPVLVFQQSKQQNRTRTTSSTVLGAPPNRTRTKKFPLEEL